MTLPCQHQLCSPSSRHTAAASASSSAMREPGPCFSPRQSAVFLLPNKGLLLQDPRSPFRPGPTNLSVGFLPTGHLNCWSQRGTEPVTGPPTRPAVPCAARCPELPAARHSPGISLMTGAYWLGRSRFPVKEKKKFLPYSEQTVDQMVGFQALKGTARGNAAFSSIFYHFLGWGFQPQGCSPHWTVAP